MQSRSLLSIPLVSILLVMCAIISCSVIKKDGTKLNSPPPLEEAKRVVIAPFMTEEKTEVLEHHIPSHLGTALSDALEHIEWVYDHQNDQNDQKPVMMRLKKLGVTTEGIFTSPALAAEVGRTFSADFIVVAKVENPRFKMRSYEQPFKRIDKTKGISGSAVYLRQRQNVAVKSWVKVIQAQTGTLVFSDQIDDDIKYWYAYMAQTRVEVIYRQEDEMVADVGKHLARRIAYILYPKGIAEVKKGEVLLKPDIKLQTKKGFEVTFD